jgi:hypothetical protein
MQPAIDVTAEVVKSRPVNITDRRTLEAHLTKVRGPYMKALHRAVAESTARAGAEGLHVVVEAELRGADGEQILDDPLDRCRYDVLEIGATGAQPIKVYCRDLVASPSATFRIAPGFELDVHVFVWNACVVVIEEAPSDATLAEVRAWFTRWFDHDSGGQPFSGRIHFMELETVETAMLIRLDLGSAPERALIELLDVLAAGGIRKLTLATPPADLELLAGGSSGETYKPS